MTIGLEAMACHVPRHFIDLDNLADARGVERVKFSRGLGQRLMAVATPPEDAVYLAGRAASKALAEFDIDPGDVGCLVVGTETGVDHSKPISVYLHDALGLRSNCSVFETKHACFGASAAVSSAMDWIASGRSRGSKALIVATDIARYGLRTAGEPTQGAGAVAMVVSDQPRLVGLDPALIGEFTRNVMDFWRPLDRKEAIADGHYSITCYLEALQGSLDDIGAGLPPIGQLGACLYHVPFSRMAYKAHVAHHEHELGGPVIPGGQETDPIQASYEQRTAPWLTLNRDIGNIYTGSLYLALLDLLRHGTLDEGTAISLFSYGSGCTASMRVGTLMPGYASWRAALDPSADLAARVELSVDEYEEIMVEGELVPGPDDVLNPENWDLEIDRFMYLGNKDHSRQYVGIS